MNTRWLTLILTALLALVGCSTAPAASSVVSSKAVSDFRGALFDPPRALTDISLPSTTGTHFSLADHKGQAILLYFGYLACPDLCPTTLTALRRVYVDLNQPVDKLKIVFVTVDPDRDTLDNMTRYTHAFNPDFIGVRGDGDALKQLMTQFGVVATKQPLAGSAESYAVDHTASVYLVGPDGRLVAQYLYGTDYRDIVHDVKSLLKLA